MQKGVYRLKKYWLTPKYKKRNEHAGYIYHISSNWALILWSSIIHDKNLKINFIKCLSYSLLVIDLQDSSFSSEFLNLPLNFEVTLIFFIWFYNGLTMDIQVLSYIFQLNTLCGICCKVSKMSRIHAQIWWSNLVILLLVFFVSFGFREEIFYTNLGAAYFFDIIMFGAPLCCHLIILFESSRKRQKLASFWRLLDEVNNYLNGCAYLKRRFEQKFSKFLLLLLGCYTFPCFCLDILMLFLNNDDSKWFYNALLINWSYFVIRLYILNLILTIAYMQYCMEAILELVECMARKSLKMPLFMCRKLITQQLQELHHIIYILIWRMNHSINHYSGYILVVYTLYVFYFIM
jgi:hypothetical protein